MLAKTALENVEVLDAGAGFGQYDFFMFRKYPNWNILAVDVKDEQVADCNEFFGKLKNSKVNFIVGDLTQYKKEQRHMLVETLVLIAIIPGILEIFFGEFLNPILPFAILLMVFVFVSVNSI